MKELKEQFAQGQIPKAEYIEKMYAHHAHLYEYAKMLEEVNISSIVIENGKVMFTTRDLGIKLVGKELDERIIPIEILNFGDYEKKEMIMIDRLLTLTEAKTMFDIGANVGYVSIYMEKTHPDISIHSFEPIPDTYSMLAENIANNNTKNITANNLGLSDEAAEAEFYVYPQGCGNSSMEDLSHRDSVHKVKCTLSTLDSYTAEKNVSVDFIKCDVEGAEFKVFLGGKETISRDKPVIFAELLRKWSKSFNYTPNDVIAYLAELGYQCFASAGDRLIKIDTIDESVAETNFIFLHSQKHLEKLSSLID